MKIKHLFILFFSVFSCFAAAQQDSLASRYRYQPNFLVGFDLLNSGISFFADRKLFQGFVSSEVRKNIHALAEAGFEKNIYQKNGYDATASGFFAKIGGFYMLSNDPENRRNGFYAGPKLAASFYKQRYDAVPVRGYEGGDTSVAFPSSSQASYWLEGTVGGRVQLFASDFYIDVNMQPRYLLYSTKQDNIVPMIVPGFGKSSTKFNVGFTWNLAYSF